MTIPVAPRNTSTGRRVNGLVALGSAAVMTVYAAGYARTREAAERLADAERQRPPIPAPADAGPQAPAPEPPADLVARSSANTSVVAPPAATPAATSAPPAAAPPARVPPVASTTPREADRTDLGAVASAMGARASTTQREIGASESTIAVASAPSVPDDAAATEPARNSDTIAPALPKALYRDGTYSGYGTSRHGDIEATLVIAGGRITSAEISKCYTRWPCSWIKLLPPQVVQIQSPEVDFITGATVSTYAFYYAVIDALNKAK
jgi:uncharacterized protein with FMN-binding domain